MRDKQEDISIKDTKDILGASKLDIANQILLRLY
jgi:hypothetical protein